MEDVRWPAKQLEEHRLEISNRIRNLFWTVSGDYDMEFEPDTEKYVYSKQTVLYEAVKQGAFARYFDQKKLGMYLMKKLHFSAGEDILLPLAGLCMDAAVERFIIRERLGTKEIREQAFRELEKAEKEQVSDKAGTDLIHRIRLLYIRHVLENTDDEGMDPQAEIALYKILSLKDAENTEDVINVIDEIYNHVLDPSFEKKNGNLEKILNLPDMALTNDAWQECMTDEQMEDIIQKYLSNLKKKMMSLDIRNKKKKRFYFSPENEEVPESSENINPQAVRRIREYVELNYGKSYLSESEQARVNRKFCTGIHKNCNLYLTDGILQSPVIKNNQYRFSQLQFEKNKAYYGNNHWIIKRNISVLAESLKRAFIIRKDDFVSRSDAGQLVPERLWKIGRTDDDKLFNRKKRSDDSEFVIDVLIDSSGSQADRQAQVAAQGYIISEALSQAGIPHRVTGYCAFWGSLDHLQKDGVFLLNKVNENPMVTLALYYVMPRSLMAVAFYYVSNSVNSIVRKSMENAMRMVQAASMDDMTGLYSKNKLLETVEHMEPKERPVAVIYWDVNQLKYVNDTFGHLYGDQLIAKIAGSIRAAVTSEETNAYRYGGDEFLMIIPDGTQEIAEDVIEKWRQVMKPIQKNSEIPVSASVGYAVGKYENIMELIEIADQRMYKDKQIRRQ